VPQSFKIRGYALCVDVARFDTGKLRLGWGHRFRRRDFSLLQGSEPVVGVACAYLRRETGIIADQVFLLANPRIFGYVFNPVSFFFYYQASKHVATAVEVNNTFGEQKHFVLPADPGHAQVQKNFYVSPFFSPFLDFALRIQPPGEIISISIHTRRGSATEFSAEMRGEFRALTRLHLLKLFCKYPFHTLRVITLIHWYALKLFARGVPHYAKDAADAALIYTGLRRQR
jgi:DUF1365 family protein